jgi:hypothetical protein
MRFKVDENCRTRSAQAIGPPSTAKSRKPRHVLGVDRAGQWAAGKNAGDLAGGSCA